jgi:spermidine dehydrogenase
VRQRKGDKVTASERRDRELGMHRRITRRDFLNGVSMAVGGSVLASSAFHAFAGEQSGSAYPPAHTGMRGSYDATYTIAHSLRDGTFWESAGKAEDTGEACDLVVVGAGISGLAAAYFFRKANPKARILILDNHDDFGGHAKRNEFRVGKRLLLSNGGTQSIESPSAYSAVAKGLLSELGVETQRFYRAYDQKLYSQLGTACFFDKETFGEDRLVPGMGSIPWADFLRKSSLSEKVRQDIERLYTEKVDYLPGLAREEKRGRLGRVSYADFLTKVCNADPAVLPFFQTYSHDLFAVGIDGISALACYQSGDDYGAISYPGFQGMNLGEPGQEEEPYIFHFPDGNASIARLLVRSLIPRSIPGHTMEDVVTARADYSRLDQPQSGVRIRLNSTVVAAKHVGESGSAKQVEVSYVRDGKLQSARGAACVLACYNGMVPYLCPELPEKQKEALHYGVKMPLIYTHVAIRNWAAFHKLGVRQIVSPGSYHCLTMLDFPVNLGQYRSPSSPDEPMVLFMLRTPCKPGLPRRDQYRMGRFELFGTPFSTFERNIRDQLQRMLGGSGFDSARDIAAITVNRWAHGYAYDYDSLSDPDFAADERPCVIGRKQFGRISIANSDAGARAFTDEAIDQAYRAVQEQLRNGIMQGNASNH